MTETPLPAALTNAVAALWRIPPPGPNNLLAAPRFVHLRDTCESLYPRAKSKDALSFALSNALQALGLPSGLAPTNAHLALPAETATELLDAAFRRTEALRVYLCPLDLADDLPLLKFGPNSIRKFTTGELEALVDPPRLQRINANWMFDAHSFSFFHWLVVNETYPLDKEPGERAAPLFYMLVDLNQDWGRIEPHKERFPAAVEATLFAVLLAPWEEWAEHPEVDWRCFQVPWVHKVDEDIFVRPRRPPSPDTLSWEPHISNEGEVDGEQPTSLHRSWRD